MAQHWGRKETIIWPPHAPIVSYGAIAAALLLTCFLMWQRLNYRMSPLQQSYITEYVRSEVGTQFKAHESYKLVMLAGEKVKPRLALPVDLTNGKPRSRTARPFPSASPSWPQRRAIHGSIAPQRRSCQTPECTAGSKPRSTGTRDS